MALVHDAMMKAMAKGILDMGAPQIVSFDQGRFVATSSRPDGLAHPPMPGVVTRCVRTLASSGGSDGRSCGCNRAPQGAAANERLLARRGLSWPAARRPDRRAAGRTCSWR